MVLKRIEVVARKYPFVLKSDDTLETRILEDMRAPEFVIDRYKDVIERDVSNMYNDSRLWSTENIDDSAKQLGEQLYTRLEQYGDLDGAKEYYSKIENLESIL